MTGFDFAAIVGKALLSAGAGRAVGKGIDLAKGQLDKALSEGPLVKPIRGALIEACRGFTESLQASFGTLEGTVSSPLGSPQGDSLAAQLQQIMEDEPFLAALGELPYVPFSDIDPTRCRALFEGLSLPGADDNDFDFAWRALGRRYHAAAAASPELTRLLEIKSLERLEERQAHLEELLATPATLSASDWEPFYLRILAGYCDQLDLSPLDERDSGVTVQLSDVFTALDLEGLQRLESENVDEYFARRRDPPQGSDPEARRRPGKDDEQEKMLPVTAVEAAATVRRLVVLGRPGGGKSTLVNHLAVQLARRRLGHGIALESPQGDKLPGWPADANPLPVRILLRRFAAWLPADAQPHAGLVWDYLEHQLQRDGAEEAFPGLKRCLKENDAVVFFDGLDEVHEDDARKKRTLICRAVERFAAPLVKCRVIVTCREYAYHRGDAWRLADDIFTEVMLAPFGLKQVKAFTETWYRVLRIAKGWDKDRAAREAAHLTRAVEEWKHLRELAESPLLLTLMAQIHGRDGYLPRDRADLYERTVNLLLAHWENRIVRDLQIEQATAERDRVLTLDLRISVLRKALEKVAFAAHERQETKERSESAADIPRDDLLHALDDELGSLDHARDVITYIQQRAGLLTAVDQTTYRFPHRTFQEYLAARHLLQQGEYDTMLRDRVRRDLGWWREIFLLAAGSSRETPRIVSDLVDQLVPRPPAEGVLTAETAEEARLAAQALEETGFAERALKEDPTGEGRFAATFEKIQQWLLRAITATEELEPEARARCGASLAGLRDPRDEVTTIEQMEFCLVPGGPFWMGNDDGHSDEKPAHLVEQLTNAYWISRFPVTVEQFRHYVEKSGAKVENAATLSGPPNAPVVYVSWFEALGFCRWLSESGLLPEGSQSRLPTETEWEKAARGGVDILAESVVVPVGKIFWRKSKMIPNPAPQREYPWSGDFDRNRCNSAEVDFGSVSAVGCFPNGRSVYGCEEMSGNVWEWTATEWDDAAYKKRAEGQAIDLSPSAADLAAPSGAQRVVRGGGCWSDADRTRAAYRISRDPDSWADGWGFRVLLPSPPPRGS